MEGRCSRPRRLTSGTRRDASYFSERERCCWRQESTWRQDVQWESSSGAGASSPNLGAAGGSAAAGLCGRASMGEGAALAVHRHEEQGAAALRLCRAAQCPTGTTMRAAGLAGTSGGAPERGAAALVTAARQWMRPPLDYAPSPAAGASARPLRLAAAAAVSRPDPPRCLLRSRSAAPPATPGQPQSIIRFATRVIGHRALQGSCCSTNVRRLPRVVCRAAASGAVKRCAEMPAGGVSRKGARRQQGGEGHLVSRVLPLQQQRRPQVVVRAVQAVHESAAGGADRGAGGRRPGPPL